MKKLAEVFGKNRLMSRMREYTGFQKLLFFFIPLFCLVALDAFFLNSVFSFPNWVKSFVRIISLWMMFASWAYLIIGSQAHWKERTRNLVVNIVSVILMAVVILLGYI